LKIVPSADIGELGPQEGAAIVHNWKWHYGMPALALWVVLVLAIVLVKANRNPRALLILVPLLIINLLWSILEKARPFPSSTMAVFDQVFVSLTVGIAVLWLLCHKLGNRNRFIISLLAFVIMAVIGLIGAVSYGITEFSEEMAAIMVIFATLLVTMLLGFVLSGWCCRKCYSGLRFMLWLAVWTVAVSIAVLLGYVGIGIVITSISGGYMPPYWILLTVFGVGLVLGLCVYVINLPYMILALRSSFFRERFYACLRLKSMRTTAVQADADQLGEQSQAPAIPENSDSAPE